MSLDLYQVDAFADRPFTGNPAAVCLLPAARDPEWMQAVAREMNLSETAFLHPHPGGDGYLLRWFTPAVEVELCGHATLASAHVLWERGHLGGEDEARFHTASGLLTARRAGEGWIEMDFPAKTAGEVDTPPAGLAEALGVVPRFVGRSQFDYLVEVDSEAAVRGADPDFRRLKELPVRGVLLTAAAGPGGGHDIVSRCFFPASGIDEDPVTGSAHCTFAVHWAPRLGREAFLAYQASARGGTVRVRLAGERVHLGGRAVTVLGGQLLA